MKRQHKMKWEDELPKPKKYSHESKDYPKWLRYGGICDCDDGFLCEHRHDYIYDTIQSLLDQQQNQIIKIIEGMRIKPSKEQLEKSSNYGFIKPELTNYQNGYNTALDDLLKAIKEWI